MTPPKRPSARLVVLDPHDRVLLFHFVHSKGPLAGQSFWATPGGALDEGESFEAAARRELLEETGLAEPLGPQIGQRHVRFMMPHGGLVDAEERYFAVRCAGIADHSDNPDPIERSLIAASRWWSAADLAASSETIFPEDIAAMLADASAVV